MIKILKNSIIKVVDLLEMIIGAFLVISIAILIVFLAKDLKVIAISGAQVDSFNIFLASAFNLVIGQRNTAPRQRSPIYDIHGRLLRYRAPGINIVGGKKVFTPVHH